jgi:outer membrane protein assembly factor BamB
MRRLMPLAASFCLLLIATAAYADQWPRFRGPGGRGVSDLKGVPATWTENDLEWKVTFPGVGHSCPVIWNDKLFLTSGTEDGDRTIHGLDAISGKEIWSDTIKLGANPLHKKNSYASGTPAVDEERVYVSHADTGKYLVVAYRHNGEQVWEYDLGAFKGQHGQGMSPILYKEMLIVTNDQDGPSSIIALNRKTGKPIWTANRPSREVSYSTPFVFEKNGTAQLICVSGITGMSALSLETGESLWAGTSLAQRTVGSPVEAGGMIFVTCGQGGRGTLMVGIDPLSPSAEPFTMSKGLPYVPTPVAKDGHLFLWTDDGFCACLDVKTRKELWRQRVGGNYSASPIIIDDKIYAVAEDGQVAVVGALPEYKLYGKSPLGDNSFSTPSVANGRVYFRTFHHLLSLKAK